MVLDTGQSIFVTGKDNLDTGKWTYTGKSSFDTGQDIWDTGEWSWILVNSVLILVKTSGIMVSGLGYW